MQFWVQTLKTHRDDDLFFASLNDTGTLLLRYNQHSVGDLRMCHNLSVSTSPALEPKRGSAGRCVSQQSKIHMVIRNFAQPDHNK